MASSLPLLLSPAGAPHAVILFDYENVYLHLRERYFAPARLHATCRALGQGLIERLADAPYHTAVLWQAAYADFDRLPPGGAGGLARAGFEPVFVAGGSAHKNAADMRLCVDALELAHTRPEIGTFVLVSGDGDYLPLVQRLRRYGRRVVLVGFPENTATELAFLFSRVDGGFLEGLDLLPPAVRAELTERRADHLLRHHGVAAFRTDRVPTTADGTPDGITDEAANAVVNGAVNGAATPLAEEVPRAADPDETPEPPRAKVIRVSLGPPAAPALTYTPAPPGWVPPPTPAPGWAPDGSAPAAPATPPRDPRAARRAAVRAASQAIAADAAHEEAGSAEPAAEADPVFAPVAPVTGGLAEAALRAVVLFTPKTNRKPLDALLSNLRLQLLVHKLSEARCLLLLTELQQAGALVRFWRGREQLYCLNLAHPDVLRFQQPHMR